MNKSQKITNNDADLLSEKVRNENGKTRVYCYLCDAPISEYFEVGSMSSGKLQTLRRQHLKTAHAPEIFEAMRLRDAKLGGLH